MRIDQAVGQKLLNSTSVTSYTSNRIYHALRPEQNSQLPSINFFELPETVIDVGITVQTDVQISPRSTDPGEAESIANAIQTVFHNLRENFTTGDATSQIKVQSGKAERLGLLPEENNGEVIYHCPVNVNLSILGNIQE